MESYFFTVLLTVLITSLIAGVIGQSIKIDDLKGQIKKLEKRD